MEFKSQNGVIRTINEEDVQNWTGVIILKDTTIIKMTEISYINILNQSVGLAAEYGMREDVGYDQLMINERFGGGNGVGCFFQKDGKIYVGLTCEKRNGGQPVWELPRFFCGTTNEGRKGSFEQNLEKDHFDFDDVEAMDKPTNCNSAYNFTANADEGLQVFFVEIEYKPEKFVYFDEDDSYAFANMEAIERDKSTKKIIGSRFFEIDTLCANQDVYCSAFVGKFWTHVRTGKIKIK